MIDWRIVAGARLAVPSTFSRTSEFDAHDPLFGRFATSTEHIASAAVVTSEHVR